MRCNPGNVASSPKVAYRNLYVVRTSKPPSAVHAQQPHRKTRPPLAIFFVRPLQFQELRRAFIGSRCGPGRSSLAGAIAGGFDGAGGAAAKADAACGGES